MSAPEPLPFTGFPVAALDFYDDLEVDNSRTFFERHKAVYAGSVRGPMESLTAALAPEFGAAKVFRPHRDVRFAKDRAPYKTHQGAFVATGPATGLYVEVSARGVRTGAGFYGASARRLAHFREAVSHDEHGPRLEAVVEALRVEGWEVGGDRVKTSPRGWSADHPRIELLRHRSLSVGRSHGFDPVIHTAGLLEVVRDDWRRLRPLIDWLAELPPEELDG